jgi:hypothetical protein
LLAFKAFAWRYANTSQANRHLNSVFLYNNILYILISYKFLIKIYYYNFFSYFFILFYSILLI